MRRPDAAPARARPAADQGPGVERDLRVPMPDGACCSPTGTAPGDGEREPARQRAAAGADALPVRAAAADRRRQWSSPLAERGFQVILQSARGTFGSGGEFEPMRQRARGRPGDPRLGGEAAVVRRLDRAVGGSYLGYVQWAVADRLPPEVKAIIPQVTDSALTLEFLRRRRLSLETPFGWGVMIAGQERRLACCGVCSQAAGTRVRCGAAAGRGRRRRHGPPVGYIQDILAHDADDPHWAAIDHRAGGGDRPCRSARSAAGTTSSCPASSVTSPSCRRRGSTARLDGRAVDAPVGRRRRRDAGGPEFGLALRPRTPSRRRARRCGCT